MADRKHILFVIVGISAGTGTFCKSLGAGLRKHFGDELKVSLLTFRPDALLPENATNFDESHVLSTRIATDWRRLLQLPGAMLRLRRAVRRIRPDLIFTIGTFANVATSLAIRDVPVALSDHLNMTLRLKDSRFGFITRFLMRRAYPGRLMVVASRELATDLQENFGANRTAVIPNGIDASVVRLRAQDPSVAIPPNPYFISVGRLTAQKDVATAIRAFSIARKDHAVAHDFAIVGDGEQRPMLEALARELGIERAVRFLGHCPNPYPLIAKARGLILSSIWEGFAYVPIEAMALGVPVVSTACPSGPSEILGDGEFGLLVPPSDPAALAGALAKLAADDSLHEHLAHKAAERAAQLSVHNMAGAYRDLFAREIAHAAAPSRQDD